MMAPTTEYAAFVRGLGLPRESWQQGDWYALMAREPGRGRRREKAIINMLTGDREKPQEGAIWLPRLDQWLELLELIWPPDRDGRDVRSQILKRLALWIFDDPDTDYTMAAAQLYHAVMSYQAALV